MIEPLRTLRTLRNKQIRFDGSCPFLIDEKEGYCKESDVRAYVKANVDWLKQKLNNEFDVVDKKMIFDAIDEAFEGVMEERT